VSKICKTNARQAPERPRIRRRGGQPGNRNAARSVTPISTLRAQIRDLGRRFRALKTQLEETMVANERAEGI
jgi:hypothetical protein